MSEIELVLDLSWRLHGDEWLGHLHALIEIEDQDVFGGSDPGLFDHIQCTSGDPRLHSFLWVTRGDDDRIVCTIVDDDPGGDRERFADQIGPWREAVVHAAALVGTLPAATWNAILGPRPQLRTGGLLTGADTRPSALAAPARLGPVLLTPGGVCMHEMPDAHPQSVTRDRFPYSSWPLIVQGTAVSYGEYPEMPVALMPMDDQAALRAAHRTAALVSLAWDECWIVRHGPLRVTAQQPVTVPHLADGYDQGRTPWARGCALAPDQEAVGRRERELPGWLAAAWAALDTRPELSGALDAFYEALQLEATHPSAAALLYVTVVEGIGAGLVDLTPCPACGMSKGATKRFRTALRTVMSRKQADALAATAYERRSRTAHVGVLHGAEATLGRLPDSDFHIQDAERFETSELAAIRQAARTVLTHALASHTDAPMPG